MKKFCFSLVAIVGLLSASMVFADTDTTGGYITGQVNLPNTVKSNARGLNAAADAMGMMATNIIIVNFSNYYLLVTIEGLTVKRPIDAGAPALLTNPNKRSDRFHIWDGNGHELFANVELWLCSRAIVTIDGGPDVFHMNVERKYCI